MRTSDESLEFEGETLFDSFCFFVMPRYMDKDLHDIIAQRQAGDKPLYGLPEKVVHAISLQILAAVKHLHAKNMAHGDIKLANVILDSNLRCKLVDFGFAQEKDALVENWNGTRGYMASELCYLKEGISHENPAFTWEKTDVFSLGVLIFVLRFGNLPFKSATSLDSDY